uniref:Uncharacterized protein n=1 Tax=Anopheles stephensi TaxID=30069 RepID=A0A182Y4L9_ANOST
MTSCRDILLTGSTATDPYSEWNNTCRTCLQAGETRSIFELEACSPMSYAEKVMQCASVAIREHDNLPDRICTQCIDDLNVAYRFRLNCLEANALLLGANNFDCFEAKTKERQAAEVAPCSPDDGRDQIAIQMDSGVIYTYKPPIGLDVKLTQPSADDGAKSAPTMTMIDPPSMSNAVTEDDNMLLTMDTTLPAEKRDEIEYIIYVKDDNDEPESTLPTMKANAALMEPAIHWEHTEQTVVDNRNHSTGQKRVKTLQTIRKTNRPNEMKPTIETVTSQPVTDAKLFHFCSCTICGRRFAKSHHLKSHRNTHQTQSLVATVTASEEDGLVELHGENNNIKQETVDVVYSALLQDELIASNDVLPMNETTPLLLGPQSDGGGVLVDVFPDTGAGLIPTEWSMVDGGVKGEHTGPSVVTITPEELENVSIVTFNDYMMKTAGLDGFLVEDEPADVGDVLVERPIMDR